jgi:hypothetical protein
MKFKYPHLQTQLYAVHQDVRDALNKLDGFCLRKQFPEVVVTHVLRTDDEQEALYWKAILKKEGCTEVEARLRAREKFSWHKVGCAVDIRNSEYSKSQLEEVMAYLRAGRAIPLWELLSHDVGNGAHVHIGRKDFTWRSLKRINLNPSSGNA